MEGKPHRNLYVWQKSVEFVLQIYKILKRFPVEERFGIISQMQRAAISIPSNIAEGAARRSRKEYLQFLYNARGSLSEIDTQLEISYKLNYLSKAEHTAFQNALDELSKMLNGLIVSLMKKELP